MDKFREYLKASGETQAGLAARLRVSQGHLSEVSRFRKEPSGVLAYQIELATEGAIPMQYWFEGTVQAPAPKPQKVE